MAENRSLKGLCKQRFMPRWNLVKSQEAAADVELVDIENAE